MTSLVGFPSAITMYTLSTFDVAHRLGLSMRDVWRLVEARAILYVEIGGVYQFSEFSIERYVEGTQT